MKIATRQPVCAPAPFGYNVIGDDGRHAMTLGDARDISLIILIIPALICLIVPAAIVFGALWATLRVRAWLRSSLRRTREGVRRFGEGTDKASLALARPIVFGETQSAKWRARWRALRQER